MREGRDNFRFIVALVFAVVILAVQFFATESQQISEIEGRISQVKAQLATSGKMKDEVLQRSKDRMNALDARRTTIDSVPGLSPGDRAVQLGLLLNDVNAEAYYSSVERLLLSQSDLQLSDELATLKTQSRADSNGFMVGGGGTFLLVLVICLFLGSWQKEILEERRALGIEPKRSWVRLFAGRMGIHAQGLRGRDRGKTNRDGDAGLRSPVVSDVPADKKRHPWASSF